MYRFVLTPRVESDLARIDALHKQLDARGVLPRRWAGRLRRDLEAESVAASTSMEGVPVTVEEVRRILVGDRPGGVSEEDAALVSGYRDAMSFVLRRTDDPDFTWEPELIRSIHDRVLAGSFSRGAGRYREGIVQITAGDRLVYTPPDTDLVAGLVVALAQWLTGSTKMAAPVVAALAHVQLAGIHPFADGNGRTARILASLVMFRRGFTLPEFTSLEEWWGSHRDEYYAAFGCLGERWDSSTDVSPFVEAHVGAQRAQVETLALKQGTERVIWTVLEDAMVEDMNGYPRMTDALFDAFFGRDVTNRYYRGLADVSSVTASHDLSKMVASGLLKAEGAGRSTTYRGTARLAATVGSAMRMEIDETVPLEDIRPALVAKIAEKLRG